MDEKSIKLSTNKYLNYKIKYKENSRIPNTIIFYRECRCMHCSIRNIFDIIDSNY